MVEQNKNEAGKIFGSFLYLQPPFHNRELAEHIRVSKEKGEELLLSLSKREHQLQTLMAASIQAQEEERQWIAFEVHDRIAQTLTSVFQLIQRGESLTQSDEGLHELLVRASILLRQAIRESRNIMNDLHPPLLDKFGLVPLVEEELQRFQEDTNCQTELHNSYMVRPPSHFEVALYRIFHEALVNVRKHATGTKNVAVTIISKESGISLLVEDDGYGFDIAAESQANHLGGLQSMRRRANILGGTLEIASSPGQGTRVLACIPVSDGDRSK